MGIVVKYANGAMTSGRRGADLSMARHAQATSRPIGVPPMSHDTDIDGSRPVVDCVNDPVVPDANAPEVGGAFQLGTPGGSRILGERLEPGDDPQGDLPIDRLKLLPRGTGDAKLVVGHGSAAWARTGPAFSPWTGIPAAQGDAIAASRSATA